MTEPRSAHDAPATKQPLPGAIGGPSGLRRNLLIRLRQEGPSAPEELAAQVVYVIDQPWGISISDITVRASGDLYLP